MNLINFSNFFLKKKKLKKKKFLMNPLKMTICVTFNSHISDQITRIAHIFAGENIGILLNERRLHHGAENQKNQNKFIQLLFFFENQLSHRKQEKSPYHKHTIEEQSRKGFDINSLYI